MGSSGNFRLIINLNDVAWYKVLPSVRMRCCLRLARDMTMALGLCNLDGCGSRETSGKCKAPVRSPSSSVQLPFIPLSVPSGSRGHRHPHTWDAAFLLTGGGDFRGTLISHFNLIQGSPRISRTLAVHTVDSGGGVIYSTRGLREISHGEIYHREFDLSRKFPPSCMSPTAFEPGISGVRCQVHDS